MFTRQIVIRSRNFSACHVLRKAAKPVTPALLNLQVGQIKICQHHPDADKLYVSQIAYSENEEPLTVCSGLVDYIPIDQMQGKKVILVTNLKPANMRGITSQAMVLAAEKIQGGHLQGVELVTPPIMSEIGQQLVFEGFEPTDDDVQRVSPKAWKKLQPNLFTDSQKRVIYRDTDREEHFLVLRDSGAPCTVESATDAPVR